MKTNKKMLIPCAAFGLLLNVGCVLICQPAHAQASRRFPLTPEAQEAFRQSGQLAVAATIDLHKGRYAQAESEARQALAIGGAECVASEVLPAALEAQGKDQEALQLYHAQIIEGENGPQGHTRLLLPYAELLLRSSQWGKALAAYNQVLSQFPEEELVRESSQFTADTPDPAALAVAIYIERGRVYSASVDWAREPQNTEAMAEYGKALQLAPDSALTNFYYGQGWQKLSPAERTQFGTVEQARAALRKAVKVGRGNVKKAAQKALLVAMKLK